MIKARLFVWGIERELLRTELEYHRTLNDKTGRPGPIPMGGLVTFSFISGYNDDVLLRWITHSPEDELCTLTVCKIVFYEGDLDGIVLFEYQLNDAALVYWKETFHSVGEESMTVTMAISAAIQEIKGSTWVKPWQESGVPPGKNVIPEKGGAGAALGDGRKRVDDGGEPGKAAKGADWDVLPTNLKYDKGAHVLANEIGGIAQARFRNSTREFDAISDKFIGQHKPALGNNFGKSFRNQARATFNAAKKTGREVYYRFDGRPGQKVIDKLSQYASE